MPSPYIDSPDQDKLRTLSKSVLVLFMIVALALFFWGVLRAGSILARSDNPRLIEEELRIRRGSILDKNGTVLALSEGSTGRQQRIYPFGNIGPAVGFYSVIHGAAGAENAFDDILRNDPPGEWQAFWHRALHLPQEGRNVKLALDTELQLAAISALGRNHGAALLLEQDSNASERALVRALVSIPDYDANFLDEQFDTLGAGENAPLLNRVTQGQYQPGLLLQPFILAFAVEKGLLNLDDLVADPNRPVQVNGNQLRCQSSPPDPASWVDVLRHRCPGPMVDLADQLGIGGLDAVFTAFELYRDPLLELDTISTPEEPLRNPLLAGIGQENLSVTPLQIGLATGALANGGKLPQAQIGLETQDSEGGWQPWAMDILARQATTASAAAAILQAQAQENGIYEHNPLVLSGPNDSTNAWYTGILESADSDFIVVVILEGANEEEEAVSVGREILAAVQKMRQ